MGRHQGVHGKSQIRSRIPPIHLKHVWQRNRHPNDEGGLAWNDPAIGIEWPELVGEYKGSADSEGYTLSDGTALNLSDKDKKWDTLENTFKF